MIALIVELSLTVFECLGDSRETNFHDDERHDDPPEIELELEQMCRARISIKGSLHGSPILLSNSLES